LAVFRTLSPRLGLYWSIRFEELPDDLRDDVQRALPLVSWNELAGNSRKAQIAIYDYEKNPANLAARELDFSLYARISGLKSERRELEIMRATSPLQLESQKRQLAEIDAQIAAIEAERSAPAKRTETPKQRDTRLLKRRKELRAAGINNPTQTLANEFEISEGLVRRIVRESKPKPKKPGGILR